MNLKSEKGITLIDIAISIIIIAMFLAIIAVLFYSIRVTATDIDRKKKATEIAISTIENLKTVDFDDLESKEEYYNKENSTDTSYYIQIIVTDYADMQGNSDKKPGVVKEVVVKVSYKSQNQDKSVEISIIRTKEN